MQRPVRQHVVIEQQRTVNRWEHPMPEAARDALVARLPLPDSDMELLVSLLLSQCGFADQRLQPQIRAATATRRQQYRYTSRASSPEEMIILKWRPLGPNETCLAWLVRFTKGSQRGWPDRGAAQEVLEHLEGAVWSVLAGKTPPNVDPVLGPGEPLEGPWEGQLRDYSGCATLQEVCSSRSVYSPSAGQPGDGVLPLGRYAFGWPPQAAHGSQRAVVHGPMLYLGRGEDRERMEYRGTLVCAPPGSGKTELILRWAVSAILNGYSTLIVDVKGDMQHKLAERFQQLGGQPPCNVYHFSTNPAPDTLSDRTNFLSGLTGATPMDRSLLQRLATAILPRETSYEKGEEHERAGLRIKWLTAMIGLVLLHEQYVKYEERARDLSDVHAIASNEARLNTVIREVAEGEEERLAWGLPELEPGLEHWVNELNLVVEGSFRPPGSRLPPLVSQRSRETTFPGLTWPIVNALRPFSRKGALYHKISGERRESKGARRFQIADLLKPEQMALILEVRAFDLQDADAVISMVMAYLQLLLFERQSVPGQKRPILLLLDETRRIRGFDANDYLAVMRSAAAGVVLVYQELHQIADGHRDGEGRITELLRNVGTQIYLHSVVDDSYSRLMRQLPERARPRYVKQRGPNSAASDLQISLEDVAAVKQSALFDLPAGRYPALVYMRDHPCKKPFLVDMDEDYLEIRRGAGTLPAPGARQLAVSPEPRPLPPDSRHTGADTRDEGAGTSESRQRTASLVPQKVDTPRLLHTLEGRSAVFSPDGRLLASASDDTAVRLWNVAQGELLHTLHGHTNSVSSLAFSSNGQFLASASADRTVRLWSVADGGLCSTLEGHEWAVNSVTFSSNGPLLASASNDATVRLWAATDGRLLCTLTGHASKVIGVAFAPDGRSLASVSFDETVRLWAVDNGALLYILEGHTGFLEGVAFSPDGRVLASGPGDRTVRLWNVADGTLRRRLDGHDLAVTSVAFAPDSTVLASASYDGTVRLWRVADGTLLHTLGEHFPRVTSIAFAPAGRLLAAASVDRAVRLWRVADGTLLHTLAGHKSGEVCVRFSPVGQLLASASDDCTVRLWSVPEDNREISG
jgi:WD40 repeat protein